MVDIVVPKWGLTMEEAVLNEWTRSVGDIVAEGESLAEIETDKITDELLSPASGRLAEITVEAGADVEPGQVIGRIDPL